MWDGPALLRLAMNPFTRFLRQWSGDKKLETFIEHCDALESLIIRVYKRGKTTAGDEAEYQALRRWMNTNYPAWKDALRPIWKEVQVGGAPVQEDPFLRLTCAEHSEEFVDDWKTLQHLPAAREALNKLVLARSEGT